MSEYKNDLERLLSLSKEKQAKYYWHMQQQDFEGATSILYPQEGIQITPPGLSLKEKVYFWVAQANACSFPLAFLYGIAAGNEQGFTVAAMNSVAAIGSIILLQYSRNRR